MTRPCAKFGHQTRQAAQGQRAGVGPKHGPMNVYRCPRCGLWHVGRSHRRIITRRKERTAE